MELKRCPFDSGAFSLGQVHEARQFEDHVLELERAREMGLSRLTAAAVLQRRRRW